MNVGRLDPLSEMAAVRDRINRLMEETGGSEGGRGGASRVWRPLADILEDRDAWTILLDLPGLRRESIDIQLTAENLVVRGERPGPRREDAHLIRSERPEGAFLFVLPIAAPIDHDRVEANYRDGVLSITLPKAETLKPRKVRVTGGESESGGETASGSTPGGGAAAGRRGKPSS